MPCSIFDAMVSGFKDAMETAKASLEGQGSEVDSICHAICEKKAAFITSIFLGSDQWKDKYLKYGIIIEEHPMKEMTKE